MDDNKTRAIAISVGRARRWDWLSGGMSIDTGYLSRFPIFSRSSWRRRSSATALSRDSSWRCKVRTMAMICCSRASGDCATASFRDGMANASSNGHQRLTRRRVHTPLYGAIHQSEKLPESGGKTTATVVRACVLSPASVIFPIAQLAGEGHS